MVRKTPFILAAFVATAVACSSDPEDKAIDGTAEVAIAACVAGARPATGFGFTPALNDIRFSLPVAMLHSPRDPNTFYVVEKKGIIKRVTSGVASTFIDMQNRVNASPNEAGLLGVALHPKFAENGVVLLSYTKPSSTSPANLASVIARAKTNDGGLTLDPSSIVELLSFDQPYSNHNGGHIAFGKDGFLYASFGDGGSGGDPQGNGQKTNTFLGKILRIDIDRGTPYAIPADNPFASGGGKPEIYAYGLRNTWRFSFDRVTGDLWAGDVGQNKWEEVDKIVKGGNYGWNPREGKHCYTGSTCNVPGAIDPVAEYDHSQGYSITGGFVYRGRAIPSLVGQYLYGDYGSGKIWAISTTEANPTPRVLLSGAGSIASFAEDNDGELYILDYGAGKVKRLVVSSTSEGLPLKLSQTGCFDAANPTQPAARLVPYDLASPLWSDAAEKARWMSLPTNGKIRIGADGDMDFPPGTVLVKEFKLGGKRIETRLFVRHTDTDASWAGYTYEWNDAGTDATLLPDGKTKQIGAQVWTYPSRSQCMGCHNSAAGFALGPEVAQLNVNGAYGNQLDRLQQQNLIDPATPLPATRPTLANPADTAQSAEARARSYLHSNCSFCHRPQGPGRGEADLRFTNSFRDTKLCNGAPSAGDLGIPNAKLLVPGIPEQSLLSVRMHRSADQGRMPPLASVIVDETGVDAVDDWIRSVTACP